MNAAQRRKQKRQKAGKQEKFKQKNREIAEQKTPKQSK